MDLDAVGCDLCSALGISDRQLESLFARTGRAEPNDGSNLFGRCIIDGPRVLQPCVNRVRRRDDWFAKRNSVAAVDAKR